MVSFKDVTGTPRSDKEVIEALSVVRELFINPPMDRPRLAVNIGVLKDSLEELLLIREKLRKRGIADVSQM